MLVNPDFPDADTQSRDLQKAALNLGLQHHILSASSEPEFEIALCQNRTHAPQQMRRTDRSLDYRIGKGVQLERDVKAERPRGLEVDSQCSEHGRLMRLLSATMRSSTAGAVNS
jgi:hypothetical protein